MPLPLFYLQFNDSFCIPKGARKLANGHIFMTFQYTVWNQQLSGEAISFNFNLAGGQKGFIPYKVTVLLTVQNCMSQFVRHDQPALCVGQ